MVEILLMNKMNLTSHWFDQNITNISIYITLDFAAACIVDQDVSSLVEDTPPEQLGSVVTPSDGLSIIEKLLVASDCE